jgi:hypothetical protein
VGAEERRLLGGLPGDGQRAGLVADGEAVAALDLDGRGALRPHLGEVPGHIGGELLIGRGAGGGDRGADAPGFVRSAGHPRLELRGTITGEDEVRVGVDEAGDHRSAAHVAHRVRVRRGGAVADPGDVAVLDDQCPVADHGPLVVPGDQLADVGDQQTRHTRLQHSSMTAARSRATSSGSRSGGAMTSAAVADHIGSPDPAVRTDDASSMEPPSSNPSEVRPVVVAASQS